MEYLVIFLIVVVIIGALSGGKTFGEVIRHGLGWLLGSIVALIVGFVIWSESDSGKEKSDTTTSSQNKKNYVCVFNASGRDLNYSIEWNGDCNDEEHAVKKSESSLVWCAGNVTAPPKLSLQWTSSEAESFQFKGVSTRECSIGNSLRVNPTKYGNKWSVSYGKWN